MQVRRMANVVRSHRTSDAAFVLIGIAFTRAMGAFRWVRDHYSWIRVVSGFVLVALGLLLFFHRDWWLNVFLHRALEAVGLSNL